MQKLPPDEVGEEAEKELTKNGLKVVLAATPQ